MNKLGTTAMFAIATCNSEYGLFVLLGISSEYLYLYNGVTYSSIYDSNYGLL